MRGNILENVYIHESREMCGVEVRDKRRGGKGWCIQGKFCSNVLGMHRFAAKGDADLDSKTEERQGIVPGCEKIAKNSAEGQERITKCAF
jgi:hypothetical protein